MIELIINGKRADLATEGDYKNFNFTYKAVDLNEPTAIKNSFSKTVELPTTKTNNDIFGEISRLDRTNVDEGFNPNKRLPFVLLQNGNIVEKGYVKLDKVTKNDVGVGKYSVTLYGELGDFFYNLCYNEDGEQLTLADLYYGFNSGGSKLSKNNENTKPLCQWNSDYIKGSWDKLYSGDIPSDKEVNNNITAAPTYTGYHDDFDNAKVLINKYGLTGEDIKLIPTTISDGYNWVKDWALIESQRDMSEWEVRDLRSVYQRPCVRFKAILDAISNPDNNGGFEVDWTAVESDEHLSKYLNKSWMILNTPEFEDDVEYNSVHNVFMINDLYLNKTTDYSKTKLRDIDGHHIFNFDTYNEPKINVSINPILYGGETFSSFKTSSWTCGIILFKKEKIGRNTYRYYYHRNVGLTCYRLNVYQNGNKINSTNWTAVGIPQNGFGEINWTNLSIIEPLIKNELGNNVDLLSKNIVVEDNLFRYDSPIVFNVNLPPNTPNIEFELEEKLLIYEGAVKKTGNYTLFYNGEYKSNYTCLNNWGSRLTIPTDSDENIVYDGITKPTVQKCNLTKKLLFAQTERPFDYLVSFTKMLNLKYRVDEINKTIYIEPNYAYYTGLVENINDKIDRSKSFDIKPTNVEYKFYEYSLECPETYASKIYALKDTNVYGGFKLNTGYDFNNDVKNIFDGNVFKDVVPYKLSSCYFHKIYQNLNCLNTCLFTTYLWKLNNGKYESSSKECNGAVSAGQQNNMFKDYRDKFCLFDSDNKEVNDCKNILCFFEGFDGDGDYYCLSDNIKAIQELNDNNCFIYYGTNCMGYGSVNDAAPQKIGNVVTIMPHFSKTLTSLEDDKYHHCIDFAKPKYSFVGDLDRFASELTIYDHFWKKYIQDIYDKDSKSVDVYVKLEGNAKEKMRNFYYFDGCIWVINEITDWNPENSGYTKVNFIKVKSVDNYINQ